MNKIELANLLVKDASITKANALKFLDALIEVISEELKKEGKVTLAGFGTFKTVFKKQKKGRNPKTGVMIIIPEKKAVRFLPGKALKKFALGPHGPGDGPDEFEIRGPLRSADVKEEIGIHGPGLGPDEEL